MSNRITPLVSLPTRLRISTEAPYDKWLMGGLVLPAEGTATFYPHAGYADSRLVARLAHRLAMLIRLRGLEKCDGSAAVM